jgi:hypothetical protein
VTLPWDLPAWNDVARSTLADIVIPMEMSFLQRPWVAQLSLLNAFGLAAISLTSFVSALFLDPHAKHSLTSDCLTPQYLVVRIYRLTFHPLAKYPGRLIEKLSDWPLVVYCIQGNRHVKQRLAHEKYGKLARLHSHRRG